MRHRMHPLAAVLILAGSTAAMAADWQTVASRVGKVPEGVRSYIETLREGARRGLSPARRQVAIGVDHDRPGVRIGCAAQLFAALNSRRRACRIGSV